MSPEDNNYENSSDDEIFAELERDIDENFDMTALRERRLEELNRECVIPSPSSSLLNEAC